ncbi:general transcription factor IIH subunit 1-like isoform X2 [Gordionus sp. m RMFG-2023]|uniref:general transcription factor IIH subunit 1-like isoform X2 n=1 Tax=Gordionus sp. m RMFG-2023 TaxID=3053472 RepID=UPI0031FCC1EE
MKSSEEVYALITHVRHKKVDGSLYIMSERMAWSMEKSQNFSVSYKYSDIKTQKISPEGKVKIQLQIVLHSGETSNFHFNSPEGTERQLQDRLRVKDLLQQLLPRFRKQVDAQLEKKNLLLQKNPQLFTLYKELVVTQIITPEEFWGNYVSKYQKSLDNEQLNKTENVDSNIIRSHKQLIGVSASFLSDLTPQSDGANGIKYNLTSDIIDSIFRIYPSVKQKHEEHVPHVISDIEFWTKFFQSHYFYRDRNLTKQSANSKDYFFSECLRIDEKSVQEEIEKGEPNPLLDLENFDDETVYSEPIFDLYSDINNQTLTLIQRFNQHSILLSQATLPKRKHISETGINVNTSSKRLVSDNAMLSTQDITIVNQDIIEMPTGKGSNHKNNIKNILKEKLSLEYQDLIKGANQITDTKDQQNNLDNHGEKQIFFKLNSPEEFSRGPIMDEPIVMSDNQYLSDAKYLADCRDAVKHALDKLSIQSTLDVNVQHRHKIYVLEGGTKQIGNRGPKVNHGPCGQPTRDQRDQNSKMDPTLTTLTK